MSTGFDVCNKLSAVKKHSEMLEFKRVVKEEVKKEDVILYFTA